MDKKAFRDISYGLYIVSSNDSNKFSGCIANAITQITSENPIISISLNKNNYTNEIIKKSKKVAISILNKKVSKDIIGKFGFYSSKDINKFENIKYELIFDLPVVKEGVCSYLIGDVINIIDAETHDIFLVRIKECKKINDEEALTYLYYQTNMKGTSSKNAPTYIEEVIDNKETASKYKCLICGYIYDDSKEEVKFEDLPSDWVCPLCGASKDQFVKIN